MTKRKAGNAGIGPAFRNFRVSEGDSMTPGNGLE